MKPSSAATSESPTQLQPTAAGERIQVVDILRGWAIFGILVVNMLLDFSGGTDRGSREIPRLRRARMARLLVIQSLEDGWITVEETGRMALVTVTAAG